MSSHSSYFLLSRKRTYRRPMRKRSSVDCWKIKTNGNRSFSEIKFPPPLSPMTRRQSRKVSSKTPNAPPRKFAKKDDFLVKTEFFKNGGLLKEWVYKFSDSCPWHLHNDLFQYESDFIIRMLMKHQLYRNRRRK